MRALNGTGRYCILCFQGENVPAGEKQSKESDRRKGFNYQEKPKTSDKNAGWRECKEKHNITDKTAQNLSNNHERKKPGLVLKGNMKLGNCFPIARLVINGKTHLRDAAILQPFR